MATFWCSPPESACVSRSRSPGRCRAVQGPRDPRLHLGDRQAQVLRPEGQIAGHRAGDNLARRVLQHGAHAPGQGGAAQLEHILARPAAPRPRGCLCSCAGSRPLRQRSKVDLPHPLGPATSRTLPGGTWNVDVIERARGGRRILEAQFRDFDHWLLCDGFIHDDRSIRDAPPQGYDKQNPPSRGRMTGYTMVRAGCRPWLGDSAPARIAPIPATTETARPKRRPARPRGCGVWGMGGNAAHGRRCRAKLTQHKQNSHDSDECEPTKNLSRRGKRQDALRVPQRGLSSQAGLDGHLTTLQVAEWSTGQVPRTLVIAILRLARL